MEKTLPYAHHHAAPALHGLIQALLVRAISTCHLPNGMLAESCPCRTPWLRLEIMTLERVSPCLPIPASDCLDNI